MVSKMDTLKTILTDTLKHLGVPFSSIEHDVVAGQDILRIETEDTRLLANHADGLYALDYLIRKLSEHSPDTLPRVLIDIHGYRVAKIKEIQDKARILAERARSFAYEVEMSPMSSYERLIVHATLAEEEGVETESRGEGRERRVVIKCSLS